MGFFQEIYGTFLRDTIIKGSRGVCREVNAPFTPAIQNKSLNISNHLPIQKVTISIHSLKSQAL